MAQDRTRRREPSEAQPAQANTSVLLQVAGPGAPRAFTLDPGEHVLGRDPGVDVHIASDDVSRRHAKVVMARGGLIHVLDLGSTNGTFVNGSRAEMRTLQRGDSLALGDARLLVTDADTAARVLALGSTEAGAKTTPPLDLTDRQIDIARLVAHGLTNAEIADRLQISRRTVTSHLDHIYTRLQISSRAALVSALARAGLLALLASATGCLEPTPDFADPRRDLLVDWVFDDEQVTVVDGAPERENLELVGGQWVLDDSPPHLRFDGVDDVGVGPDLQAIVPELSAITLEVLVRIDSESFDDWTPRPIVEIPQSSADGNYTLGLIAYPPARRMELSIVAGDRHVQVSRDGGYETGAWTVVHGVYDGASATAYVDGEPIGDPVPLTGTLDAYDFDYGEQTITVGGGGSSFTACGLARSRIWSRGLSADEVAHRARQLRSEVDP